MPFWHGTMMNPSWIQEVNRYISDLVNGLADHHSVCPLRHGTSKDSFHLHVNQAGRNLLDLLSGLANNLFNHHSVWSPCNHHFGGLDYRPHGSLATIATRTSVSSSYTLRPSNRHYFPSKPLSPSSHIRHPRKRKPYLRCLMAI